MTYAIKWKTHRDGIWPMDIANLPGGTQVIATQYERRISALDPFKRKKAWLWSITSASGRKMASGNNASTRHEAREQIGAALAGI